MNFADYQVLSIRVILFLPSIFISWPVCQNYDNYGLQDFDTARRFMAVTINPTSRLECLKSQAALAVYTLSDDSGTNWYT